MKTVTPNPFKINIPSIRVLAGVLALGVVSPVESVFSQVLMLDFGTVTVTGSSAEDSPYHSVNTSFSGTNWNKVVTNSSTHTGLTWADGTSATGVAFNELKNVGTTTSSSQSFFRGAWGSPLSGSTVNSGIYTSPSVGSDGYMFSSTITDNRGIGIQVSGLAFGTYDIYMVGRNTNYATAAYDMNFFASVGNVLPTASNSSSTNLNLGTGTWLQESNAFSASATDKVSAWSFTSGDAAASNYVKFTMTIDASNPYLNLIALGDSGSAMAQGVLNSIQIVAVPEPSTVALVGLGLASVLFRARRRTV